MVYFGDMRSVKLVVLSHVLNYVELMLPSLVRFVVISDWACQASAFNSAGHRSYTWWQHIAPLNHTGKALSERQGTDYLTLFSSYKHGHACSSIMVAPSPQ